MSDEDEKPPQNETPAEFAVRTGAPLIHVPKPELLKRNAEKKPPPADPTKK
jgi:hypothetical protein